VTFQTFLSTLELLGLLTALLDFTGYSQHIQTRINARRYKFFRWLKNKGNERLADAIGNKIWFPLFILSLVLFYALFTNAPYLGRVALLYYSLSIAPLILLFIVLPIFYNFLLLINKPPSGTVGTISLLIALGSFFLQRWDTIVGLPCRFISLGCE
jgi:hypothetical protein